MTSISDSNFANSIDNDALCIHYYNVEPHCKSCCPFQVRRTLAGERGAIVNEIARVKTECHITCPNHNDRYNRFIIATNELKEFDLRSTVD